MLVSVILASHNRAGLLGRAVDSVLSQSGVPLELIVVDDGSTDGTPELLSQYSDPRLQCLRISHSGVSRARNAGLEAAQGECLALLDSDDRWLPDKLKQQLAFMRCGGWSICQTEERWIRRGRRVNPGQRHRKRAGWIFEPSLELCLVSPSCVMFSRRLWEEVGGFDESLPACEDYDLWLRTALRYPIGLLPKVLTVKYGGHADQLSRRIIGLDLYRISSLRKLLAVERLSGEQRRLAQGALSRKADRYIQGCLKRNKPEEAERVRDLVRPALQPGVAQKRGCGA